MPDLLLNKEKNITKSALFQFAPILFSPALTAGQTTQPDKET
jgi:hypothetical protein